MNPAYKDAVNFFLKTTDLALRKGLVQWAWQHPQTSKGGALFLFCTPDGTVDVTEYPQVNGHKAECGCLTQVRGGSHAYRRNLTIAIRADERLPDHAPLMSTPEEWTKECLEAFAEWQQKMDDAWPGRREIVLASKAAAETSPYAVACELCGHKAYSLDRAREQRWEPYYYVGEVEKPGPVCPMCVGNRLQKSPDGELELIER